MNKEPWPIVPFNGGLRLWDTDTTWANINTANGAYDWTTLDNWLTHAGDQKATVLYTFGHVPQWASSNPNDQSCQPTPGSCDPPDDLNPDGSGTDQHWKDYVTALASHSNNSSGAHIKFWELWNEPHNLFYWNGTYAQLVRMGRDLYTIVKSFDPDAVVLTPAFAWSKTFYLNYMDGYLAAGGGAYADVMSVHGYVLGPRHTYRDPETVVPDCAAYRAVMKKYGQSGKPIWNTEANWGTHLGFDDPDMQAAWLARFYLLHTSLSVKRLYWFTWNGIEIGLWAADPHNHRKPGKLLAPGIAYRELNKWMVGAKMTPRCSSTRTVWTCGFRRSGGYQALAVWDTSQTCSHNQCTTSKYRFDGNYVDYLTLDGHKAQINGQTVLIGAKPILLQNQ